MAIFKCKMCGGTLDINNNETVAVCEYCGSKQTVPTQSNEVITNLFNRANNLRLKNEFDKAAEIYGKILDENDTNSEAHWCLLLCKYGIEYVEDPKTYKRIPTCHRAQYTSVLTDPDYLAAVENADVVSKEVYAEQAHEISELQKSILAIVKNEKPFDVFICYKESDENGKRTVDSALANDIYYQLTKEGLRVFYAAITLEDKLGQEYEPYIFAALNTAKVMLVIGTKPEYFEAVWVRNEWSRFLALMKTDRNKMLIPCYRDMDAYELPEEFAHLQAQDMAKIGFINDLVRGIKKVTAKDEQTEQAQQASVTQVVGGPNVTALLKRGRMAIEDGDFEDATGYFNEVLNMNAECAEAYLGLAMADTKLKSAKELIEKEKTGNKYYQRAKQFANDALLDSLNNLERQKVEEDKRISEQQKVKLKAPIENAKKFQTIVSAGDDHTVGLKSDGTVVAVGEEYRGQCKVSDWTDIIAVAAGDDYTVGLKKDSTVVAVGCNYQGQCEVSDWTDIVAVAAGYHHCVGLRKDGTVVATKYTGDQEYYAGQCEVSAWTDIVAVSAGYDHTVGLKKDGTVVATKYTGEIYFDQCEVSGWTDIVAVSAGNYHTVGLKNDGTVVAVGKDYYGQCEVSDWTDIIAVAAGDDHTVGLKYDGTVVVTKYTGKREDYHGQCEVSGWTDIIAVAAGDSHTVGLKKDGTVVATEYSGNFYRDQCEVSGWKLFDNADNLENERAQRMPEAAQRFAAQRLAEQQRLAALFNHNEAIYAKALNAMNQAQTEQEYRNAASMFASIGNHKDAVQLQDRCTKQADAIYADEHSVIKKVTKAAINIPQIILNLVITIASLLVLVIIVATHVTTFFDDTLSGIDPGIAAAVTNTRFIITHILLTIATIDSLPGLWKKIFKENYTIEKKILKWVIFLAIYAVVFFLWQNILFQLMATT